MILFCAAWAVFPLFEYHAAYSMGKYEYFLENKYRKYPLKRACSYNG